MIKNILLVVMTIVSLMFFAFGFIQKIEADKHVELAVTMKMEAERAKSEEIKAKDMAFAAQAEAEKQRLLLEECEKSKKK